MSRYRFAHSMQVLHGNTIENVKNNSEGLNKGEFSMDIAIIGLGKMGANMAHRLILGGHRVIGTDRSAETVQKLAGEFGLVPAASLADAPSCE